MKKTNRNRLQRYWYVNKALDGIWYLKLISRLSSYGSNLKFEHLILQVRMFLKTITENPTLTFYNVLYKLKPLISLKWKLEQTRSKKKKNLRYYQIPCPATITKSYKLAIKWFRIAIKSIKLKVCYSKIVFLEIIKIIKNKENKAISLKKSMYNSAIKNRAAVRYKW